MQASPSMRSLGNVSGVVHVAPPPGAAPPGEAHLEDLTALQSKIGDPAANVHDAGSECRVAMDRLVGLAAARGPGGEQARTALRDIYASPIGEDKRVALLNAAFAKMGDHASITVNYMGALAPPPPKGDNGGAHIDAAQKRLAQQLGSPFDRELNLLAEGRTVTDTEMQAASPKLNWRETISLATPADAQRGFSQVLNDVATHHQPITIWVADSTGHCVPVVAQPTPSGAIRFHVITSPTDEAGPEIGKDLAELTGDDCVIVHKVTTPHLVLQHLNADFDDDRGAGGVIREHLDDWSNKTPEDRRAANLAGQAALFEAAAIRGPEPPPVAKSPSPTSVEGKFSKLEDSFNKQELTKRSGQVHSAFDGMSEAIGLSRRLNDPKVPMADRMRLQLSSPYAPGSTFAIAAPEVRNFYQPARALAENFNESKAPKLFAKVGPGNPLGPVSIALNKLGSGESATQRTIVTQQKLLQECHDASKAKDLPRLNRALQDIEAAQVSMVEDIDSALGELEVLQSNAALDPELAAEATALIAALQDYRACLQGENGPNVYADLVAFAQQATAFGPSLQHAQSLFQQVGSTPRAIATPNPLQPPLPEIVVHVPDVMAPIIAPPALAASPAPVLTRAQKFDKQNLRVIAKPNVDSMGIPRASYHVESSASRLALALNAMPKTNDPNPRISEGGKRDYDRAMADLAPWGIDDGYIQKAWTTMGTFSEKRPWLAAGGPAQLMEVGNALTTVAGAVGSVQFATRRGMLLDAAYAEVSLGDKSKPGALKKVIDELATTEEAFFANIDGARAELEKVKALSEDSASWKAAGIKDKDAEQIKKDAVILLGALDDMEALAKHKIFSDFKDAFYDPTEESLLALTQHFKDIGRPAPPEPAAFSALASAAGFGESSKPESDLVKAMAQVKAVQEKPATRSLLGRPLDKKSGPLAQLGSVSSPEKLDEVLKQAVVAAGAVDRAPNSTVAMGALYTKVADAKKFAQNQLDGIYDSIKELKGIESSSASKSVKADAQEMRVALEFLGAEWENKAQKIVAFAELGAVYPEEAQVALTSLGAAR